jgi:hypothetical protein
MDLLARALAVLADRASIRRLVARRRASAVRVVVVTLADVPDIVNPSFAVVYLLPHDRPRPFARASARAFVKGNFAHVPEAWRDRLPLLRWRRP